MAVEKPSMAFSRKTLDFGPGFYTTTNMQQAIDYTANVLSRRNAGKRTVSIYEFDLENAKKLNILKFQEANEEWLDFVYENRKGIYNGKKYDVIQGPVADDDVFPTILLYESGTLTKKQTIEALMAYRLFDQFVLCTDISLKYIHFKESFNP